MSSNELFVISPSEALLLGLCIGEYRSKLDAKPNHEIRFISTLQMRVRPHFPSFGLWEKVPIVNRLVPDDVAWVDNSDGKVGFSNSEPHRVYYDIDGDYSYLNVLHPRRSFFDLLIVHMSRSLNLSRVERIVYAVDGDVISEDDTSAIESFVTELVDKSQLSRLLDAGKLFGELLCLIEGFQDYVFEVTDPDNEPHEYLIPPVDTPQAPDESDLSYLSRLVGVIRPLSIEEIAPPATVKTTLIAERLRNTTIVSRCHYADTILQMIRDLHFEVNTDHIRVPFFDAARISMVDARHAQMCFWLAFGDVLGVLHDADSEFNAADIESAAPRVFRLTPEDTPDRVLNQIRNVERELASIRDFDPFDVVTRLNPLIEAIARRVWPHDFQGVRESRLASLFKAKLLSPRSTTVETRLASIGLSLNGSYRNPVTHQFDAVEVSFDEARFFVGAIRAMVDLWRQINESRLRDQGHKS